MEYRKVRIQLIKDVDNLKAGTELVTPTKLFMNTTVYEITTERGTFWIGDLAAKRIE